MLDGERRWIQENRLCFGLRSAPYIFNFLSELIVDFAQARGINHIENYLGEFAIVGDEYEFTRSAREVGP